MEIMPEMPPLPALNIRTRMPMQQAAAASSAGPRAVEMSSRNMPSGYGYANGSSPQIDWDALETSSDDSEDVYGGTSPVSSTVTQAMMGSVDAPLHRTVSMDWDS